MTRCSFQGMTPESTCQRCPGMETVSDVLAQHPLRVGLAPWGAEPPQGDAKDDGERYSRSQMTASASVHTTSAHRFVKRMRTHSPV
jgi:hypothetical protein